MAIRITTRATDDNLVGKSHWWGAPDLPEDVPYPCVTINDGEEEYEEPLTFVCQINCTDIAAIDSENLLPHTGILYFFAPINYFLGEYNSPVNFRGEPIVIYSAKMDGLQPYVLHWEDSGESIFIPAEAITFSAMDSQRGDGHILLGKPYQDDVSEWHPDSISLLQIDEDDAWNLRFFDCGMYYFLASPKDLAAGKWDNVVGELYFY